MVNKIKHLGIVENIDGLRLKVRIVQSSACSACSVRGHCSASEQKEKLIDVYNVDRVACEIGERVMVVGATSMGMKAVLLAFVLPFVLVVVTLFVVMRISDGNEVVSALAGLGILLPFYLIIYMCKGRLGRTFFFTLESNQ
ncbi:MAG: SoxR reducing system RseC family protein [Phocaeicola plebeius]|nr:SoxR reducing system RseC family protein [Phocaeicola plebeius]